MSEEIKDSAVPDEVAAGAPDEQLGDGGKRALAALRDEIKSLKASNKALSEELAGTRDASSGETDTSDAAMATDVDDSQVATTDNDVKPPRFQGTVDGGARKATSRPTIERSDLAGMSPNAIAAALKRGELRHLLNPTN